MSSSYDRPPLSWVKRRARRIQRFYHVSRRMAVFDAWRDYADFVLGRPAHLIALTGGRK